MQLTIWHKNKSCPSKALAWLSLGCLSTGLLEIDRVVEGSEDREARCCGAYKQCEGEIKWRD